MNCIMIGHTLTIHQIEFVKAIKKKCTFDFIATTSNKDPKMTIEDNRLSIEYDSNLQEKIDSADVVIYGSAPESMIKNRLKSGKLTFKYSERMYKGGFKWYEQPLRFIKNYRRGWCKKIITFCAQVHILMPTFRKHSTLRIGLLSGGISLPLKIIISRNW